MFSCSSLNRSTSSRIAGPSPPVNPFQNASSTGGPSYSAPPLAALRPIIAGSPVPPQLAKRSSPAPPVRNSRRVSPRPAEQFLPLPLFSGRFIDAHLPLRSRSHG